MPHEKENLEVSRYDKIQINSWKIHQEANELVFGCFSTSEQKL